jgi:ATP-dependent RNA helicase DDX56/DBP9
MSARAAAAHADTSALSSTPSASTSAVPSTAAAAGHPSPADEDAIPGSKRKRRAAVNGAGGGGGGGAAGVADGATDAEFGVSRGVDFCDVTAVINMDMPRGQVCAGRNGWGRGNKDGRGSRAASTFVM